MTPTRTPDLSMRIFRAEHARDACECTHDRARHYADGGSTVWCDVRECLCRAYALRRGEGS